MLWRGKRFFLDGQCSDDEYISAISFITPIRVVTYTKENDLCLRIIQKRKTIYMFFCICRQYKCLRIQFVSMWYFIILNVFFFCKELISCVEIVPCACYCSRCYSNTRVSPMQNEGVFCCYCSGRVDGFGGERGRPRFNVSSERQLIILVGQPGMRTHTYGDPKHYVHESYALPTELIGRLFVYIRFSEGLFFKGLIKPFTTQSRVSTNPRKRDIMKTF